MPSQVKLLPGEWHFGPQPITLSTLLGSCVAITLWHPARRLGGMCHYLLPKRTRPSDTPLDGRYGEEAIAMMLRALTRGGTRPGEYEAHIYGGADTMPDTAGVKFNIGQRNIEAGWSLIDQHGFQLQGIDVGDDVPRTVTLNVATGQVDVRRGTGRAPTLNENRK